MKYRRLTTDELKELEPDFIRFLASNTITAPDWEKYKKETPEKAEELLDVFSDIVFEKIIQRVEFLEFKTKNDIKLFQCLSDRLLLVGLMVEGDDNFDFTKQSSDDMMANIRSNPKAQIKMYSAQKKYTKERDMELFGMMQAGCLISNGTLFKTLAALKK